MSNKIFIVAGEASGDVIGGYFAQALPDCYSLEGVGGQQMQQAGVKILLNYEQLSVVGGVEIIKKIGSIFKAMRVIVKKLKQDPPALLVLIDYPGFNLRLAGKAKKLGIKVMFYVSPQIWAWRYGRIKKIRKNVDLMAVLFPFEEAIYARENVPVKFVGHPIIEKLKPQLSREAAYQQFGLNPHLPIIALVPGSRQHELQKLLPDMIGAVRILKAQLPKAQFVLPLASNLSPKLLEKFGLSGIRVVENNTHNMLQLCDAAMVTSGTVTLEIAILGVPQVIVYRLNWLSYQLAKILIPIERFGLCNVVAQKTVAPELLQHQVTPQALAQAVLKIINDAQYRQEMQNAFAQLRAQLQTDNAAQKAAAAAIELMS